ncbi:glycosyltransferase family protein [Lachnobacterium bovis]|uniref:glycosyltransferase family protein n=1 Tax=Lachnobacterium bovis TaxID=140626 RepID=UPI0003B35B9B|nr:DUF3880 domain-containing protein [Lachnobacterium bovis]
MNILFLDWLCYAKEGTIDAFKKMKHNVFEFAHEDYQEDKSDKFDRDITEFCKKNDIDICFSYNFYPVLSEFCYKNNMKYISFVYDCPYVMLYSYQLKYPTNYVFLFDSSQYKELYEGGLRNVFYMILPTDPKLIDRMLETEYDKEKLTCDISFMGQLYDEEYNYYDRIQGKKNEYLNGYMDAIVCAQQKIYGYSFVKKVLTPDIIDMLEKEFGYGTPKGAFGLDYIYENYVMNRKITQKERRRILERVGREYPRRCKLFTWEKKAEVLGVKNMGVADYIKEMNLVFYLSKINLNITLRSIKTGIPLRCMDIMGSGGFLLTNYQRDLFEFFDVDKEFVIYEDDDDLVRKIDYYLKNENERKEIALNARKKIETNYTFYHIFGEIFDIVNHK